MDARVLSDIKEANSFIVCVFGWMEEIPNSANSLEVFSPTEYTELGMFNFGSNFEMLFTAYLLENTHASTCSEASLIHV